MTTGRTHRASNRPRETERSDTVELLLSSHIACITEVDRDKHFKEIQEQGVKVTRAKSEERFIGFALLSDLHPISRAGAKNMVTM